MEKLTSQNVTAYVDGLNVDELKQLVADLKADFDAAITKRFDTISSQKASLQKTPKSFKEVITSGIEDLLTLRASGSQATFEVTGIEETGSGESLERATIDIEVGHRPDCTWYIKFTFEK